MNCAYKYGFIYLLKYLGISSMPLVLTISHWGRVTHICVGKLAIIGSDNGLSPERHQAIIWTNAGILLIGPLGTNLSEILIEIQTFSLKKIRLKMSSAKCCSFRLGLNVLSKQWACIPLKPIGEHNKTAATINSCQNQLPICKHNPVRLSDAVMSCK